MLGTVKGASKKGDGFHPDWVEKMVENEIGNCLFNAVPSEALECEHMGATKKVVDTLLGHSPEFLIISTCFWSLFFSE